MTTYKRALCVLRRDLRIHDNTALNAALDSSEEVIPCFIFDDAQTRPHPYRSVNGLAFMIESLEELAEEIRARGGKLLIVRGSPDKAVAALIQELSIEAVFVNKDYTPFSVTRDESIRAVCEAHSVTFTRLTDALLVDPESFAKDDGRPYTVYTPFFKKAAKLPVPKPRTSTKGSIGGADCRVATINPRDLWPDHTAPQRLSGGGRSRALEILEKINTFTHYDDERNIPALRGTTILAPHNKFGTVSIREVYHSIASSLGASHTLIRELYWRDFFTHIAWHFPHVFGHAFHRHYDGIQWNKDEELFEKWCQGQTGFPIVDAAMRELVSTGFMHNRARMIVASFLVKDLHIDWRKGEAFFARHLTDYDPAVNNGSWQWAASTGCDAQPYFRIFNPWLQQKRFDPECIYIRKWVPELAGLSNADIHGWGDDDFSRSVHYPRPIVEHAQQKILAEEMFRECQPR